MCMVYVNTHLDLVSEFNAKGLYRLLVDSRFLQIMNISSLVSSHTMFKFLSDMCKLFPT